MGSKSVSFGKGSLCFILTASLLPSPAWAQAVPLDPCAPVATCPNDQRHRVPAAARNLPPAPPQQQQQQQAPQRPPNPQDEHNDHSAEILLGLLIVAGTALAVEQLTDHGWVSTKELDRNGPRFPTRQALGRFEVQGYASAGWPVVVEVDTLPGTTTWLEVQLKGKRKPEATLEIEGQGRRTIVLHLPDWNKSGAKVARYSVVSAILTPGERPDFQPVRVYALGAGPYAVGSTTLEVTSFQPQRASSAAQMNYSIRAHRFYQNSILEVLRLPPPGDDRITRVVQTPALPLGQGDHPGTWQSLKGPAALSAGVYQLQARAWRVANNKSDRDWTGAIGPNYVFIR